MTAYIPQEALEAIFNFVATRYGRAEQVPDYKNEPRFVEFCGLLKQAESDVYYPTTADKAVYLLVGINKGHFFSNGNKRLALVITTFFLALNNLVLRKETKEWYRLFLGGLFPEYEQWEDFADFSSTDYATYNLSIMIADSGVYGISHDELKRRVSVFITQVTESALV